MAIAAKKRQAITDGQLDALKALAMLCMLADHANWLIMGEKSVVMQYAGRLALPLFVALLAYNMVHHAQKPWRYVGRLLLAAVISQPVYDMVFAGAPWQLNILWTLTIGAAFMAGVKTARRLQKPWVWAALGALVAVAVMVWPYLEYKWVGLVLMASAYAAFATRTPAAWLGFAAAMVLLAVAWPPQGAALLALPLVLLVRLLPLAQRWPVPWWAWYAFYPVHLLVLAFVA